MSIARPPSPSSVPAGVAVGYEPATGAPRPASHVALDADTCQRALATWNRRRGKSLTFRELTRAEQANVRFIAMKMYRQEHPCQR
jgi:hypothetical protein